MGRDRGGPRAIVTKRDIGRLPKVHPEETPADGVVGKWAEELQKENDPYLRALFLTVAQTGWRPSHVAALNVADVRIKNGKPVAIVRYPKDQEFKTEAPIAAHVSPDVLEALIALERIRPQNCAILFPWRSSQTGVLNPLQRLDSHTVDRNWKAIQRKWNLPYLTPKGLRHWVATVCRREGLSIQASAWLMGHDPAAGGAMRDWYDAPNVEDMLDEQASVLPNGPLGILKVPEIRMRGDLSPEVVSLVRQYLDNKMLTREFADQMETMRLRSRDAVLTR